MADCSSFIQIIQLLSCLCYFGYGYTKQILGISLHSLTISLSMFNVWIGSESGLHILPDIFVNSCIKGIVKELRIANIRLRFTLFEVSVPPSCTIVILQRDHREEEIQGFGTSTVPSWFIKSPKQEPSRCFETDWNYIIETRLEGKGWKKWLKG
ncbi:hypothetical protein VNO78_23034 [Psophocarpus tetragonolobus]|uniref:Uncharacterized protein n=1 Tax=Psophocarpus tetragonolobus TaxID=3891 RepID=A0AAN9S5U6_PSOTE